MCSTTIHFLFIWSDNNLSLLQKRKGLEKAGRYLTVQAVTLLPGPTSLQYELCPLHHTPAVMLAAHFPHHQPSIWGHIQWSSATTCKVYFHHLPFLKPSPKDSTVADTHKIFCHSSYPPMLPMFVVARINTPRQNFDQLELEQNHTSQRKGMLQITRLLPVIDCKQSTTLLFVQLYPKIKPFLAAVDLTLMFVGKALSNYKQYMAHGLPCVAVQCQ